MVQTIKGLTPKTAPAIYPHIQEALLVVGPMSRNELALYLSVSETSMSNWIHRMRAQKFPIRIVRWEQTNGNRRELYGVVDSLDVKDKPEPPTDNNAMARAWNKKHRLLRSLKEAKKPNKTVRLNNLFGVSFV